MSSSCQGGAHAGSQQEALALREGFMGAALIAMQGQVLGVL